MEYQQLQDEIKAAMKARDNHRRDILRQVHTELKGIEVNERREVTEADVDAMLKRVIKQTKETLDGSIKAGNNQERTDTLTAHWRQLRQSRSRQDPRRETELAHVYHKHLRTIPLLSIFAFRK